MLKEIKPLLNLASQGQRPCRSVKQIAKRHLNEVNEKIRELQLLSEELRTLLRQKTGRPDASKVCPMIQRDVAQPTAKRFAPASRRTQA